MLLFFYQSLQHVSRFSYTIILRSLWVVKYVAVSVFPGSFCLGFFLPLYIFFYPTSPSNIHIWPIRPGCEFPRGAQWKSHDVNAQPRNRSAQRHFPPSSPSVHQRTAAASQPYRHRHSFQIWNCHRYNSTAPVPCALGLVACRCAWFTRKRHD